MDGWFIDKCFNSHAPDSGSGPYQMLQLNCSDSKHQHPGCKSEDLWLIQLKNCCHFLVLWSSYLVSKGSNIRQQHEVNQIIHSHQVMIVHSRYLTNEVVTYYSNKMLCHLLSNWLPLVPELWCHVLRINLMSSAVILKYTLLSVINILYIRCT